MLPPNHDCLLLANGDIVLAAKIIFVVTLFIIGLIKKAFGKGGSPTQPVARARPRPQQEKPASDLNDEISQFLKRAAERRQAQEQGKNVAAPPQPPIVIVAPARKKITSPPPKTQAVKTPASQAPTAKPPVKRIARPMGEDVSEHVRQALSNAEFSVRAAQMTDELARADVERTAHQAKMFDHQLGALSTANSATEPAPVDPNNSGVQFNNPLASLLANRDEFRRAFILQEVLQRKYE